MNAVILTASSLSPVLSAMCICYYAAILKLCPVHMYHYRTDGPDMTCCGRSLQENLQHAHYNNNNNHHHRLVSGTAGVATVLGILRWSCHISHLTRPTCVVETCLDI